MRPSNLIILAAPIAGASLAEGQDYDGNSTITAETHIPGSYIIEYSYNTIRKRQDDIVSEPGIKLVHTYESWAFSGVAIVGEDLDIDRLESLPDVIKVWPNRRVPLAPYHAGDSFSGLATALSWSPHHQTGVDKLHEKGIFGAGVRVGIVDTGISYTHVALGGGIGEGFKVEGGWDFVGDGEWPDDGGEPKPDDDPMDYQEHGTHVAGIVAGKNDRGWQGVAPEATLRAYKAFAAGSTTDEILIESFLRAYDDGCDVITCSVGGAQGWSDNVWAEVASRLVDEGVVVTISAGKQGFLGPFMANDGAAGRNVMAIATVEAEQYPTTAFNLIFILNGDENVTTAGYLALDKDDIPLDIANWPIVRITDVLNGTSDGEACAPFPEGSADLSNMIPIVNRDGCDTYEKQSNLAELGAKYIFVYGDENEYYLGPPDGDSDKGALARISSQAAKAIINTIQEGGNVTADFSGRSDAIVGLDYYMGGKPSPMSSWGGLYDLQIKPDIAAPGGNIFSTVLDNKYAVLSGTSMAAPYVAGVAALWIGENGGRDVHGKKFAKQLAQRIVSSASPLKWSDGSSSDFGSFIASVAQMGAGQVNASKVLQSDTRLSFEKMALNDTVNFNRYHDVTVTNDGKKAVTYSFSVRHSAGVEIVSWLPPYRGHGDDEYSRRIRMLSELTPTTFEVEATLPQSFKLSPGKSKTISVNFKNPDSQAWNGSAVPLYGGSILISGNNGEELSVPFMGLGQPEARSRPIFRGSDEAVQDFPKIRHKLLWGAREVRWDIFEAGWKENQWKYPPILGQNKYVGSATSWTKARLEQPFIPGKDDAEDTFDFPLLGVTRIVDGWNPVTYAWLGKLANGTQIAEGRYVMRFAALKPFGTPKVSDN